MRKYINELDEKQEEQIAKAKEQRQKRLETI